jgi:hypothetical protein
MSGAAMTDSAKALLTEIIDYFAICDDTPGDFWAHDEDRTSYCLDYRSSDGTKFWIDLDKDGTITLLWKPLGQGQPQIMTFAHGTVR